MEIRNGFTARFGRPSFLPFLAKSASPMKIRALEGGVLGRIEPFSLDFGEKTELTVEVPLTSRVARSLQDRCVLALGVPHRSG
jgi:hypothetical protein